MYRIDQPHLLWVLDHLAGQYSKTGAAKIVNQIRVHPKVREKALLALDRMLSLAAPEPRAGRRDAVAVD
jgi:quinolinate synthase